MKEYTLSISVALSTIVLLGSLLAVLAFQGCNVGFINGISAHLGAGGTYGVILGSSFLLAASLVLMIALVRQYRDRQFTFQQLHHLGLFDRISQHEYASQLESHQYLKMTGMLNEESYVFALLAKNEDTSVSIYGYKNEEDRTKKIQKLGYTEVPFESLELTPSIHQRSN